MYYNIIRIILYSYKITWVINYIKKIKNVIISFLYLNIYIYIFLNLITIIHQFNYFTELILHIILY